MSGKEPPSYSSGGASSPHAQQPVQPPQMANAMMPEQMIIPQYVNPCLIGGHNLKTRYKACGIITAALLFPIGLIALFLDTEERCTRCGARF